MEIKLAAKIFEANIAIYEIINNNKYFTPYAIFTSESNPEDIILINFESRNHYNLLKLKDDRCKMSFYETNSKAIESNTFKIFKENILNKNNTYFKNDIYKNSGKFINVRDKPNYYEDIYRFLSTIEKAKYINNFNETKIQWKFVKYPNALFKIDMNQSTKDKKYNYRNKAKNYKLENNNIYFIGYAGSNKCKLRILYLNEKNNILTLAHSNNGHLGINRTSTKVKELGYFWESLIIDIKEFIDNCPQCIMVKKGNLIKQKNKVIITKGPLERLVADGWMLDNDLKSITCFSWVIVLKDHFSKFLMSIPVKNNNADNILYCLKEFFNYVGKTSIFQSDNGSEYNNSIINNFLETNNVKHILSSPKHPQSNGDVEVVHKEVRKNILCNINDNIDELSFKKIILECVNIHNNNIHSVTGYAPSFLIKNHDEDIYEEVINNIEKKYKLLEDEDDKNFVLSNGEHLITKAMPYKLRKTLKIKK